MTNPKYSFEIQKAVIGDNGLAVKAGWAEVYQADPQTREFAGVEMVYVLAGFGLPAMAFRERPVLPKKGGMAILRSEDGQKWETVEDNRGVTVYSTKTGEAKLVDYIGPVMEGWTLLSPSTAFDTWNGTAWITDKEAQKKSALTLFQKELDMRIMKASSVINQLERAVRLGMATEEEKSTLNAWEIYSVLLHRVAPDNPQWPPLPELGSSGSRDNQSKIINPAD